MIKKGKKKKGQLLTMVSKKKLNKTNKYEKKI